jgi:Amt family ammonium transporter
VPNKGDNAWLMVATPFVILMSIPGLALFYGGLVRSKNMLSVLMQVFVVFSVISVLWAVYGYSLAFTEGNAFFGSLDKLFLKGITPDSVGATFSKGVVDLRVHLRRLPGRLCGHHRGLIVGAFAERIKFSAVLLFMVLWFTFSYLPMTHMVWYWAGPDAYTTAEAADARPTPLPATCSRRARSTSPAVPWCTSTPPSPAWSAPTWSASASATARTPWRRTR